MAQKTTDHEVIRAWAEARGGRPARVKGTGGDDGGGEGHGGEDAGLLRLDFGTPEESLEPIEWEAFFETFDANGLAFLYEDKANSRFSKLVRR